VIEPATKVPSPIKQVRKLSLLDLRKQDNDARRSIALRLVWAYLGLLFLTISIPVLLYMSGPSPDSARLSAIKELSAPLTAGISSVTGVIGFVLGYYFKSEERGDR
jgi:hypothetical protein